MFKIEQKEVTKRNNSANSCVFKHWHDISKSVIMKWRLTYKEITLIIGIAVALVIILAILTRGNAFFELTENLNFSKSTSFRYIQNFVGQVFTKI